MRVFPPATTVAFWRSASFEILLGKRGIVKISRVWLPVALIIHSGPVDLKAGLAVSLYLIPALSFWVQASILVNDLVDRGNDRAGGKERWICQLSDTSGGLFIAALAGAGLFCVAFASGTGAVLTAYAAAMAIGFFYSLRPLRFKERGLLGLFAYSSASALAYVVVPWLWLDGSATLLLLLFPTVMMDTWVHLHFHQVVDYDADVGSGSRTYAVLAGLETARRTLRFASLLASFSIIALCAFAVFVTGETMWRAVIAVISTGGIIAASGYTAVLRKKPEKTSDLLRELPGIYLGSTYLFCVLPPIMFAQLALQTPAMWAPAALSGLFFIVETSHSVRYRYT